MDPIMAGRWSDTLRWGMQQQQLRAEQAAARIAQQGPSVESAVDLIVARRGFAAAATAFSALADTERRIIDLLA
jgi:hypothetical protein